MLFSFALTIPGVVSARPVSSSTEAPAVIEITENLAQRQVRDLVAHLPDDQVHELIIRQLDKKAIAEAANSGATAYFEQLNLGIHAVLDQEVEGETT